MSSPHLAGSNVSLRQVLGLAVLQGTQGHSGLHAPTFWVSRPLKTLDHFAPVADLKGPPLPMMAVN